MSESFAELLEENLASRYIKQGAILQATVVDVNADVVIVNAGLKSEAVIPSNQFLDEQGQLEVEVGDEVEVALDAVEDGFGETRLSREKAKRTRTWTLLEEAFENGKVVKGDHQRQGSRRLHGGPESGQGFPARFSCGCAARPGPGIPGGQHPGIQSHQAGSEAQQRGGFPPCGRGGRVQCGARRAAQEPSGGCEAQGGGQEPDGLRGVRRSGGHRWTVAHHGHSLEAGQAPLRGGQCRDELEVKVLKFDRERSRVSLGLKQLGADPWMDLARRHPQGSRLFGKVTNIADYGCFVEIEDGVEGLVHVSEMDWTNKNASPHKVVQIGDEVEVMVLDIDEGRRRISLGLKQCKANPWVEFGENYRKGDRVSGQIKSITDFGVFIGLPGGIDGLVRLSNLSWDLPGEDAVRNYRNRKGEELETTVLSIDPEREHISLGVKQLDKDPLSQFLAENPSGSAVRGVVQDVDARGATVVLTGGVIGQLMASEISRERVDDARMVLKPGEEVEAKFTGVDRKHRTVMLSIKQKEASEEARAIQSYKTEAGKPAAGTTLGDLLKEQMTSE